MLYNILTRIQNMYKVLCPCPIFDWLKFQDINIDGFNEVFLNWIFQISKQNVLLFQGPPIHTPNIEIETPVERQEVPQPLVQPELTLRSKPKRNVKPPDRLKY